MVLWKPPLGRPSDSETEEMKESLNKKQAKEEEEASVVAMSEEEEDSERSPSLPLYVPNVSRLKIQSTWYTKM